MTSKTIQTFTDNIIKYKVIKDGYKTVTEEIEVTDDMPTRNTYNLEPSDVIHDPDLDYTVDTSHDYLPVITFNEDITTPDNIVIHKQKYILGEYNKEYLLIDDSTEDDNFTRIGNININHNGIISNCTTSNYLKLTNNFNPGNSSWEVYAKVTTGSSVTSEQDIFGVTIDQQLFRVGLAGTVTDRFQILVANNSTWINTSSHYGTYAVLANTTYWIKAGFDGIDTYYLDYSLDGETYIRDVSYTSTLKINAGANVYNTISSGLSGIDVAWKGLIDLSEMYIKIDNEIWWQPIYNKFYSQYQVIGTLNVTNGIANYFSSDNYIRILNFQPGSSKWEITTKVIVTSNSTTQCIFGCYENRYYCPYLRIYNGKLTLYLSSNGSSWNIASNVTSSYTFTPNTWHTVTLSWTGSQYKVIVDGTTHITVNSTTAIIRNSYPLCIGKYISSTYLSTGTVDLNNTYININNNKIWKAYDIGTPTSTVIGTPSVYFENIYGGFSSANYLSGTTPSGKKMILKIKTGSSTDSNYKSFTEGLTPLAYHNSYIAIYSPSDSAWLDMFTVNTNTIYWLKFQINGLNTEVYSSTDGENYTLRYTRNTGNISVGFNTLGYSQWNYAFNGLIYLEDVSVFDENDTVIYNGMTYAGEYITGILNTDYIDTGDAVTLNLYDVQTTDRTLILNDNRNVTVYNKKYVQYDGEILIPDHGLSIYNDDTKTWSKYRFVTLDVDDENTTIYTEGNI